MSLMAGQAGGGEPPSGLSAFKTVGSQLAVSAGGIKPATSPLTRSPVTGRRKGGNESSPAPSSGDEDSGSEGRATPTGGGAEGGDRGGPGESALFSWPSGGAYDENRQLLGTEEESSDRQSSDEEDDESKNIWMITREQLSYYMTQFRTMQPNPHGVIPGTQAKEFFEKSRLPIQELRQIWQLSDVTKDGCLSLEEFLTAMHLVVLRRNEIPLPEELPVCLRPSNLRHSVIDRHNKDLYTGDPQEAGHGTREPLLDTSQDTVTSDPGDKTAASQDISPGSQISSPGRPAPLKFDINAASVATDPSIACPRPLRLSPDSPYLHSTDESRESSPAPPVGRQAVKVGAREPQYEQLWNVTDTDTSIDRRARSRLSSSSSSSSDPGEPRSAASGQGPVSLPHFTSAPPPASSGQSEASVTARPPANVLGLQKKEGLPPLPPSPPPRPGKTHKRAQSLDLNQKSVPSSLPSLPPRASPFNRNGEAVSIDTTDDGRDHREISASIHRYKESIALLGRTVQELSQEVNDTVEERVVLEYQLDQLKTIGNSDLSD